MYCSNCGKENPDGAHFCAQCGHPLKKIPGDDPKDKKKKNRAGNVKKERLKKESEEMKMNKVMKIEGMMCGHCEATVKKALESLEQVKEAEVSHKDGTAVITLNAEISDEELKKAVEEKDYTVVSVE